MNTASTTTPSQRETNTIPIAKTASTMFAMDAMLTRWPDQLKMPRQDAYYRASGQTAKVWAEANDDPMRVIASWCAHSRRWRARLDGIGTVPAPAPRPNGFVYARVAPTPL